MDDFKNHVIRSNSVIAAHAMIRVLARRATLGNRADLESLLTVVSGDNSAAEKIALDGMSIIAQSIGGDLSTLSDNQADVYINWLSEFVVERSARGRVPDPDLGRTLLFELRKTFSG